MGKKATSPKIIAYRYAFALYDLAKEKKAIKPVFSDLTEFAQSLSGVPMAVHVLSHQKTDLKDRQAAMEALINKAKPHALCANFLKLLIKQNRFALYPEIVQQFKNIHDEDHNIRHIHAVTATKLNKEQQKVLETSLKQALNAKDVDLETDIDPSILGGILIRFGSTLVDDTIKNKLNRISQKMKGLA